MTNANRHMISLASQGFTVDEISAECGYSVEDILVVLQQNKLVVQKEVGEEAAGNINKRFKKMLPKILDRMEAIALGCQDEGIALKACTYVLDQQQGFLGKGGGGIQFNIVQISEQLKRSNSLVENMSRDYQLPIPVNDKITSFPEAVIEVETANEAY